MDSEQLFASSGQVLQCVQTSGVVAALRSAIESPAKQSPVLNNAASRYMDCASAFSVLELAVAKSAGLTQLESPSYWFDLETGSDVQRTAKFRTCLAQILQGQVFLARVSTLVEDQADPVHIEDDAGDIKLRLVDAADRAADPDRISRLIDGVDLIYRACARLAQLDEEALQVARIGGKHGRTVVFNGEEETATATRRIIRAANDLATNSIETQSYSIEDIADSNPFMRALDDLFRIGAISADDAEDIRRGVLTGSIMVLECGARLYGVDAVGDPLRFGEGANQRKKVSVAKAGDAQSTKTTDQPVDDIEYLILELNKPNS